MNSREMIIAEVDALADRLLSKDTARIIHESADYIKVHIHSNLKKLEKYRKEAESR